MAFSKNDKLQPASTTSMLMSELLSRPQEEPKAIPISEFLAAKEIPAENYIPVTRQDTLKKERILKSTKECSNAFWICDRVITRPNDQPILLHVYNTHTFPVFDMKTEKLMRLEHENANSAVGIDNKQFVTASGCSMRFWSFDTFRLENEYFFGEYVKSVHHSRTESLGVLNHDFILGLTITDYDKTTYAHLWAMNIATGRGPVFDFSAHIKKSSARLAPVPGTNKAILYKNVNRGSVQFVEIGLTHALSLTVHEPCLNLPNESFFKISISENGQYLMGDMRYMHEYPDVFGVYLYRIEGCNLIEIERIHKASHPVWQGNKLLYSYNKQIYEFDPESLSHTRLANNINNFIHLIIPNKNPRFFKVAGMNEQLDNYEKYDYDDLMHQVILPEKCMNIIDEYADLGMRLNP